MNILYINDFAPTFPSSFFESLYALSLNLKEKKHNLHFIFPLERDYISRLESLSSVYYNKSFMGKKFSLSLLKLSFRICRKEKIEIIHTNFGLSGFITGNLLSIIFGIHHISHERNPSANFIQNSTTIFKRLKARLIFKLLNLPSKTTYIAISKGVKESLTGYNKVNPTKIVLIPNAVLHKRQNQIIDHNNFYKIKQLTKNQYIIGMIAHFGPQKDHRTLVDAVQIIIKKIPQVIFLLIGGNLVVDKSNFREQIEMYIKEKKLEDYFILTGEIQNPMPYIELFDIGCLISNWEGFGNALVEYMLNKKPVIGTAVGGIKDIIDDGINGFLVPPKRQDIIADKIIFLIKNPIIAKEMGKNGYKKAIKEYRMDIWVNRIIKLYESVS